MKESIQNDAPDRMAASPLPALATGYLVWLVATVLFAIVMPTDALAAIPHYWLPAFLAGAFACIVVLAFTHRSRGSAAHFIATFGAFALPVSLLIVGWNIVVGVYRMPALNEAFQTTVPIAMLLVSGLALLYSIWSARRPGRSALTAALIPPGIMAAILLGYFAWATFGSESFRYRDAFEFGTVRSSLEGKDLKADCMLTIHKPGDYVYSAGPLLDDWETAGAVGEIVWPGGKSAPATAGEYPVSIVWRGAGDRGAGRAAGYPVNPEAPTVAYFSISRPDGDRTRIIRAFPIESIQIQANATARASAP